MSLRIFLTGPLEVEGAGRRARAADFPGNQGRRAFAYLAIERGRPIARDELADAVWHDAVPPAWDGALSALVSKLRRLLSEADPAAGATIGVEARSYTLRLPADAWVDTEAAATAVEDAEAALRRDDARAAWGPALVAVTIAHRPFLAGEEGAWVERRRQWQRSLLVRGLDCLSDVYLATGDAIQAVQTATESTAVEPYRETAYQRLMRAHAAAGNRAEALRAYARCRALLSEDLGVDPSPATEAVYLALLRS
jgi:SARP family transcriptional regulator, regulator of embCAB operon